MTSKPVTPRPPLRMKLSIASGNLIQAAGLAAGAALLALADAMTGHSPVRRVVALAGFLAVYETVMRLSRQYIDLATRVQRRPDFTAHLTGFLSGAIAIALGCLLLADVSSTSLHAATLLTRSRSFHRLVGTSATIRATSR